MAVSEQKPLERQSDIETIEAHCRTHGVRLTKYRKQILQTLLSEAQPVSPYELAKSMSKGSDKKAVVASIYRVLTYLEEHNVVHKLSSVHKYHLCQQMNNCCEQKRVMFLICQQCGRVDELPAPKHLFEQIDTERNRLSFQVNSENIELQGICNACAC